jgi:D-alanyl-D-alanine carboxypeptidase (penicillin-binding protein 5/6)
VPIVAVRKDQASSLRTEVLQSLDVEAPVKTGQVLGAIVVSLGGQELARFPLLAEADVDRGGLFRRALDSIVLFLRGIHPARAAA